ncbi:unnamed protein product [Phytophthora lilii]|uniref:Unnamed protein product n=1 Tax=Phytophthora lilii TaxID=2077276 RepID=A0A9W6WV68_9STRA|nr:unnamed protein product [Phytophthora lilii]
MWLNNVTRLMDLFMRIIAWSQKQVRPLVLDIFSHVKVSFAIQSSSSMEEANDAPADTGIVGKDVFCLVKLLREIQCEVEVVKPVLDELEVMRLCCSFGMLSSVNPKDFNFSVLNAREFDDDFVRFLRHNLFEQSCPGDVKFKSLFGKRSQISQALVDMKACSTEAVASLVTAGEGVYCMKIDAGGQDVQGDNRSRVVVFSWIHDELFEPQMLRGTAAFVLRFLTGLTPDVVCCTSASDAEQLEAAMTVSEEQEDDALSSYSVSFHVHKQEDQQDATECIDMRAIDLPDHLEDAGNSFLLKGSYPALAVSKTMGAEFRSETFKQTFHANAKVPFPVWLKDQSQRYRIELGHATTRSTKLCERILREFDMWPEEQVQNCRHAHKALQQKEYEGAVQQVDNEIDRQRAILDHVSDTLFLLDTADRPDKSLLQEALNAVESFQDWRRNTKSKLDRNIELALDIPYRLSEIETILRHLYSCGQQREAAQLMEICATGTKDELLKKSKKMVKQSSNPEQKNLQILKESWDEKAAEPMGKLRKKWWTAVESVLAAAKDTKLKAVKRHQKSANADLQNKERQIAEKEFEQLCTKLLLRNGPSLILHACSRKDTVVVEGTRMVLAPSTACLDVAKVNMQEGRLEVLGRLLLKPNEKQLAMYSIKVRSALRICVINQRTVVNLISFPPTTDASRPERAGEKVIHTFGKTASLLDYYAPTRSIVFLSQDIFCIYKFDKAFKRMERVKEVDLNIRSTLVNVPFSDVLLLDSTIYVTDSSGCSQAIDICNDQTSTVFNMQDGDEVNNTNSGLLVLADTLAVGLISSVQRDDGSYDAELVCASCDDQRHLPALPLDVKFLTNQVSVKCVDNMVFALDPMAGKLYGFLVEVTVRSDSYRMRSTKVPGADLSSEASLRKQHWMYTFYHVFEKFPVQGLLETGSPTPVSVAVVCSDVKNIRILHEKCHDFFSMLMSDLMSLNKPLHGLDLTRVLTVQYSVRDVEMKSMSQKAFFQTLITFLPVQICRAEANALTVLHDGTAQCVDEVEIDSQTWGAAEIAESIRFGLLSPILCAWRGQCIVITSMGKQSTGKSYFLNQLTGSSFAIAGNRCTDGAWMALRIMEDTLLVILDFEGLGSFERTDQEDVFLSVLNASVSMFTIFRMEMRFDKDIDRLFTKFQKGTNLLKNDERLFKGTLYMSVKDVNPNDRRDVLAEFERKFQKLLTANREHNFLTEMYSGRLGVNCSPPLGTMGYYDSLRHARQLIEKVKMEQQESSRGFKSGGSFHDCIRLVLAKISILDWTDVDASSLQLEINDLYRKLPGVIRAGCQIPVDIQTKDGKVPRYLMEPFLNSEKEVAMLRLDQLSRDYPEFAECWAKVNQEVLLDGLEEENDDFGPIVCYQVGGTLYSVHSAMLTFFQRYLMLVSKGPLEKITDKDYTIFDGMLSFMVYRRKSKVALWAKQLLGAERFNEEWERCSTRNHFHDQPDLWAIFAAENGQNIGEPASSTLSGGIVHLCSFRHPCTATCEAEGICSKTVRVSTSKFSGSCDTFNFELKEMIGVRKKCAIVLQSNQVNHDGILHSCSKVLPNGSTSIHGCNVRCSACDYYCDKPIGHLGEHTAAHGNMINMHFISEDDVIAWENHKFGPGEKGISEMCNMYCSSAGRGHVHYLPCDARSPAGCIYTGLEDQRRHCKTALKPCPEQAVDEVLHDKYWKTIGWEDPCRSAAERLQFAKCPCFCDASEHKGEGKSPSYCDLDVWHPPAIVPPISARGNFSYVNGHRVACSHISTAGKLHHVFVLDCSGSMRGEPWEMLVSCVRQYLRSRLASGATEDIVSTVTFGDRGIIEYERVPISASPGRRIDFHGGGTFYSNGLRQASAIFSRTDLSTYTPVMIFFTDGRPADRKKGPQMATDFRQRFAKFGLRSFVVGFGRTSEWGLAGLAEKLGGTVHEAITPADLGDTFHSISMSLGACAGLIQRHEVDDGVNPSFDVGRDLVHGLDGVEVFLQLRGATCAASTLDTFSLEIAQAMANWASEQPGSSAIGFIKSACSTCVKRCSGTPHSPKAFMAKRESPGMPLEYFPVREPLSNGDHVVSHSWYFLYKSTNSNSTLLRLKMLWPILG